MPTTLEAFALVFVLAVPAYTAMKVYKRRNPVHYYRDQQTPIEQVALYVFLGTVVNILAVLFLWWWSRLSILTYALLPSRVQATIGNLSHSISAGFTATFLAVIAYFVTGFVASAVIGHALAYFLPNEPPLWFTELTRLRVPLDKAGRNVTWLFAQLKNGDRCLGLVSEVRWIGDKENTIELTIEKTYYQLAGREEKENVSRVFLRSDDILWLGPYSD